VRIASVTVDPCGRAKRLVTVRVELSDRQETMTMSVVVPNEHDEGAVLEFGIARAKDFARGFRRAALGELPDRACPAGVLTHISNRGWSPGSPGDESRDRH
jgi:hypothetical protein